MAQRKGSNASPLLINEHPLQVLPSLAVALGLPEAMILQQLHFWLQTKPHIQEGKPYVYNTYKQWQEQFPFWSWVTMKRALVHLEQVGVVESANFNRNPIDKTKWYTINYQKLNDLHILTTDQNEPSTDQNEPSTDQNEPSTDQNEPMDGSFCAHGELNLSHPARVSKPQELDPRDYAETTTEDPPLSPPGGKGTKKRTQFRLMPDDIAQQETIRVTIFDPSFATWLAAKYPQVNADEQWEYFVRQCLAKDYKYARFRQAFMNSFQWENSPAQRGSRGLARAPTLTKAEQRAAAEAQSNRELEDLVLGRDTHNSVWAPPRRDGADLQQEPRPGRQGRLPDGGR